LRTIFPFHELADQAHTRTEELRKADGQLDEGAA
jgi:hypothetical protein